MTPLANVWLLRPATTPLIVIGLVLKICCPRATALRASLYESCDLRFFHPSNTVNAVELKSTPVGFRPTGSLIPMKNGCSEIATGPPDAPCALRLPAEWSRACAVNSPVSKATIC